MDDALEKAKAIAAKLAVGGTEESCDLGKRKNPFITENYDDEARSPAKGLGATVKKKIFVPVQEHPDVNFLGLLIGPRGATLKSMEEKTGAKIVIRGKGSSKNGGMGQPEDHEEMHVIMEGSDDAVEKASVEVKSILFNADEAAKLKTAQLGEMSASGLYVAPSMMAVGGGNTSTTGYGGKSSSIYGPADGLPGGDCQTQLEMRIPNRMVGLMIGKGGENVVKLQTLSGATMQIAKESEMRPGDTTRVITIKGAPDNIADLKRRVEEVVALQQAGAAPTKAPAIKKDMNFPFIMNLPVPNDRIGAVIGRAGATVKSIQEKSGATLYIPTEPDVGNPLVRTIVIGGNTNYAVEEAHREIFEAVQPKDGVVPGTGHGNIPPPGSISMTIPDEKVGRLIGKAGATVNDIQQRYALKVFIPTVPDPGTYPAVRTISIQGGGVQAQLSVKAEIESLLGLSSTPTPISAIPMPPPGVGAMPPMQMQPMGAPMGAARGPLPPIGPPPVRSPYTPPVIQQPYPVQPQGSYSAQGPPSSGPALAGQPPSIYGPQGSGPPPTPTPMYPSSQDQYSQYQPQQQPLQQQVPTVQSPVGQSFNYQTQQSQPSLQSTQAFPISQPLPAVTAPAEVAKNPNDVTAYYADFWKYAAYYGEAAARVYYKAWSPPEGSVDPNAVNANAVSAAVGGYAARGSTGVVPVAAKPAQASFPGDDAMIAYNNYVKQYADWWKAHGRAAGAPETPPAPQ